MNAWTAFRTAIVLLIGTVAWNVYDSTESLRTVADVL